MNCLPRSNDPGISKFTQPDTLSGTIQPAIAETHYSARFYFDPNLITSPSGRSFGVLVGDYSWFFCLYLSQQGSSYSLTLCGMDDTSSWLESTAVSITDDWHVVEIEWQAASRKLETWCVPVT